LGAEAVIGLSVAVLAIAALRFAYVLGHDDGSFETRLDLNGDIVRADHRAREAEAEAERARLALNEAHDELVHERVQTAVARSERDALRDERDSLQAKLAVHRGAFR
jgi:hypothetical protein